MQKVKTLLSVTLKILALLLTAGAILSLFRNTDSRFLKMLDFPRIQFFLTSLIVLPILFLSTKNKRSLIIFAGNDFSERNTTRPARHLGTVGRGSRAFRKVICSKAKKLPENQNKQWSDYILMSGLVLTVILQGSYIVNYTPLVSVEVPSVETGKEYENELSVLIVNVKMSNKNADPFTALIQKKAPDIMLVMEVDDWWENKIEFLEQDYPYTREVINEVAYGMVLYSKLPLEKVDVRYLQNAKVPSFESRIRLSSGKMISLHAVHPVPPTYFEKLPDNEGQDEKAMEILGDVIENSKYPTIVAGDINDVVWSYTNRLTETRGLLYDLRVGRGFYNSYNAKNPLMRWPLDHIFVTNEFRLKKLERLSKIGSDHYPVYAELVL